MTGPVWLTLDFLARRFGAPVPAQILNSLSVVANCEEPASRLAMQTCLLTSARGRPFDLVRIAPEWKTRLTVVRWLAQHAVRPAAR